MGDNMTKILLVEDDKSLREIYGVRLLAEGYDIISAGDGEEALAMAIKDRPALIVSDVMMPKISGFDMLDILRSTTETRDIKVIMMTALSSEDQRQRGQQLGADRYLVKSQVGIEDVVRTVHDVLADTPTSSTNFSSAPQPQQPAPAAPATPPAEAASAPAPFSGSRDASTAVPERPVQQSAATPPVDSLQTPPSTPPQQPTAAPQPQQPAPAPAPLPQPTAPFSTPRPASQSNRIIEPLATPDATTSAPAVADLMAQELNSASTPQQPAAPVSPEAPDVSQAPVNMPQPAPQTDSSSGLAFEEAPTPQQNNQ